MGLERSKTAQLLVGRTRDRRYPFRCIYPSTTTDGAFGNPVSDISMAVLSWILTSAAVGAGTSLLPPAKRPAKTIRNRVGSTGYQSTPFLVVSLSVRALPPQKYVYPDPIPEFVEYETLKFQTELRKKLCGDMETYGDELGDVIDVCTRIFAEFLHKHYGGPGTLLVEPFTDMMVALKDRNLPGAPFAARTSLLWAQNHVDRDWEFWNNKQ